MKRVLQRAARNWLPGVNAIFRLPEIVPQPMPEVPPIPEPDEPELPVVPPEPVNGPVPRPVAIHWHFPRYTGLYAVLLLLLLFFQAAASWYSVFRR